MNCYGCRAVYGWRGEPRNGRFQVKWQIWRPSGVGLSDRSTCHLLPTGAMANFF